MELLSDENIQALKDIFITISGVTFSLIVVLTFVLVGWFIVWRMFLLRLPLVRELVYGSGDESKTKVKPLRRSVRLKEKQHPHLD